MNVMLGNFHRSYFGNQFTQRDLEVDSVTGELHENVNTTGEDFRSLLTTNIRVNSEMTVETARMMNEPNVKKTT